MNEHSDLSPDEEPSAAPAKGEPLFRVMYDAALAVVGEPLRRGTGRARIEITPTQMMMLTQELTPAGIRALMLIVEHGYVPGKRVEIDGWGIQWLRDHGMRKYESERAAAELRDKGYIKATKKEGRVVGKQVGVLLPGLVSLDGDDLPIGESRSDGRPRTKPRKGRTNLFGSPGSGTAGNGNQPVDHGVENPDSRNPGIRSSRTPGSGDHDDVFPQVSADSREPGEVAASPSSRTVDSLFFLPGEGQALTRSDLARFFSQPTLITAADARWEVAVALVSRAFTPHSERCAQLIEWLGDGNDGHPDTRLAQIVVDLVRVAPTDRTQAAKAQQSYLRSRGVNFRQTDPEEFLAVFIVAVVSAMDSSRPIDTWGGWFGGAFARNSHFQGRVLTATLGVFNRLLEGPDALNDDVVETKPAQTSYGSDDPTYVERLRAAAQGTNWEDETSFGILLRNGAAQARLLMAYEKKRTDDE